MLIATTVPEPDLPRVTFVGITGDEIESVIAGAPLMFGHTPLGGVLEHIVVFAAEDEAVFAAALAQHCITIVEPDNEPEPQP